MSFCDRLWQELGNEIAQIVYDSEEENKEKGVLIYQKNDKLTTGPVATGTETEIENLILQEEMGKPIGSFHTHPTGFFVLPEEEEEFFLTKSEREEIKKESPFSVPDLFGSFLGNIEFVSVVGNGFSLYCITGIKKARSNIKAALLLDIVWQRTVKNSKIYPEDIQKLGLNLCKRDISQDVYKVARKAKKKQYLV